MEDSRNLKPQEKKLANSMRTSPIYVECRCREIDEIKKNLSAAVQTINTLREENGKIKEMLQLEYQEKLSSLQNECVYLQFKLKQAQKKELSKSSLIELEKMKNLCRNKDKVIEIQEQKLIEIGKSVKSQVKEFKNVIEYSKSLESELMKVKSPELQGILPLFYEFFKFSKSLSQKILYQTVKSSLGSVKDVFKDIEKNNYGKILKKLVSLCTELLRCLELNKSMRGSVTKKALEPEQRINTMTSNSTNYDERNLNLTESKEHSMKSPSIGNSSLNSSLKAKPLSKDLIKLHSRLKKIENDVELSSKSGHSKQSSLNRSENPSGNLNPNGVVSPKIAASCAQGKTVSKIPKVQGGDRNAREEIEQIDEEIPIYPKDYSCLFKEGEQLLVLIDNQNSRLSRLSKEISGTYQPDPLEISQEISSGRSENENEEGEVKADNPAFTRKRSRWNTVSDPIENFNSVSTNLRIPEKSQENLGKLKKSKIPEPKTTKNERNSPSQNRFSGYMRPNLKKEANWESVEEFFTSD